MDLVCLSQTIKEILNMEYNLFHLAGCVMEYFCEIKPAQAKDKAVEDPIYKGYKAVLDSKSTDETLVSFMLFVFENDLIICFWCICSSIRKINMISYGSIPLPNWMAGLNKKSRNL